MTNVHICEHIKNTPKNEFYIFSQQGYLLHLEDILHNLSSIAHNMLSIHSSFSV